MSCVAIWLCFPCFPARHAPQGVDSLLRTITLQTGKVVEADFLTVFLAGSRTAGVEPRTGSGGGGGVLLAGDQLRGH